MKNALKETISGHGLGLTIWNGCLSVPIKKEDVFIVSSKKPTF